MQLMNAVDMSLGVVECAKKLLGCQLARNIDGQKIIGTIVETEAYDQSDAASHSYRGQTPRTKVMFGPPGRAYVYFTYGMHYCFNIVCGKKGHGSAVLIRAVEPTYGIELMRKKRRIEDIHKLTNGPAKLCQAFGIDLSLNGHDVSSPPLQILPGKEVASIDIVETTRVGISRDTQRPWRFYIKGNKFVSKM